MPDHSETVDLKFESRIPSRSDVAGIHHVLRMLNEMERQITRINRMTVAPQGIQGAASASAASAIDRQVTALNRLTEAQSRYARTVSTTFKAGGGTFEQHSILGPGVRKVEKFSDIAGNELESTKIVTDFEKVAQARGKAADAAAKARQQEVAQRQSDRQFRDQRTTQLNQEARTAADLAAKQRQEDAKRRQLEREFRAARTAELHGQASDEFDARASLQQKLQAASLRAQKDKEAQQKAEAKHIDSLHKQQQKVFDAAKQPPPIPRMPSEAKNPLAGFTPAGMLMNVAKVTQWAAAVTVLYKTVELATYSLSRMVEIGQQTQRLSQVFSGVGGSAKELTQDVLGLAAANGRSTDEAMEAAIAWSRLQLTRVEVNDAVRVSLLAANVAEMSAADSTKALSSIYVTYGLRVSELNGVLGMLNQSSNTFNVTNRDLFDGLSRSASVAKQAGLSFAELTGLITGGVSRSGQSGSNIGNALKSTLVRLNNPAVQEVLRRRFGVESTINGGSDQKPAGDVLRELFVAYQGLNREEKNVMATRIAGATQANRFIAIMDSYIQAQKAAISMQENLNSAEIENAKILDTVKGQFAGVKSEFDKFIVSNSNVANNELVNFLYAVRRALQGLNTDISGLLPNWMRLSSSTQEGLKKWMPGSLGVLGIVAYAGRLTKNLIPESQPPEQFLDAKQNQWKTRSGIASGKANLLRAIAGTLATNPSNLEQARSAYGAGFDQVNSSNAKGMLNARADQLAKDSAMALRGAVISQSDLISEKDKAIQKAQQEGAQESEINRLVTERSHLEEQLNALKGQQIQIDAELADSYEGAIQRNNDLLGQQHALIEQISNLWGQIPVETATGKLDVQMAKLKQELSLIDQSISKFSMAGGNDADAKRKSLEDEFQKKHGEYVGAASARELAQEFDRRHQMGLTERNNVAGFGVGLGEAERLANTEKQLRALADSRRIMAERFQQAGQEAEARRQAVLALQDENALHDLLIKKDEMRVKLQTDLKNLALEQKKQYAENLLLSGPADLVRKLSVKQLADRSGGKLNLGDFMALSPDARKDYLDYTGDFKARDIKRQIGVLGPQFDIQRETKAETDAKRARLIAQSAPDVRVPLLPDVAEAASRVKDALVALAPAVIAAAEAMARIPSLIPQTGTNIAPSGVGHPIETSIQGAFRGHGASGSWDEGGFRGHGASGSW